MAALLDSWIEDVLQGIECWISTEDIDKGSIWFGDINGQLSNTGVGILCLTRDNIAAPWILFEAGALSKGLTKARVCPILINLNHTDLKPPLSQFNGTLPTKEDMLKLIKTINVQSGENALAEEKLQKSFDKWWGEFEVKLTEVLKNFKPAKQVHKRPVEDMVEEILEISRVLQKTSQEQIKPHNIRGESEGLYILSPDDLSVQKVSMPGEAWQKRYVRLRAASSKNAIQSDKSDGASSSSEP